MKTVDILPKNTNIEITSFKIISMNVILFEKAILTLELYSNEKFIRNEVLLLSTDEYNNWVDDEWLIDILLSKLGFEKKPVEAATTDTPATTESDTTDSTATESATTEQ